MSQHSEIDKVRELLLSRYQSLENKRDIMKSPELKGLFAGIKDQAPENKAGYGNAVNTLKLELEALIEAEATETRQKTPIDLTAPFDLNAGVPNLLASDNGSIHPIRQEIEKVADILTRMGFAIYDSPELDDQYHMFETLNFPKGHPARDEYDTFMTAEKDANGDSFIAPAHTSTMQHRILKEQKDNLEEGEPIAASSIDRVFRNEDLDARHEHTFYQCEGIYVDKGVHAGMLVATLKALLESYFEKELSVRINPFYFPFTEPSFEFSLSCPFCDQKGCSICSQAGWIELLGCGMIHPNVLRMAGIDPEVYTGFAWGMGIERLIMMKHGIEDIRHFESAKLDFLRQF